MRHQAGQWGTAEWDALGSMIGGISGALAVAAAGVALFFAGRQLSELIRSNNELAASNANLMRPFVVVDLKLQKHSLKPGSGNTQASAFVLVQNIGRTPAKNLTLSVDPPFESTVETLEEMMLPSLNETFSGKPVRMLTAARPMKFLLDRVSDALKAPSLPQSYTVVARYSDIGGTNTYEETFELEMGPWALTVSEEEPLARLSKDLQAVADAIKVK